MFQFNFDPHEYLSITADDKQNFIKGNLILHGLSPIDLMLNDPKNVKEALKDYDAEKYFKSLLDIITEGDCEKVFENRDYSFK